MLALSLFLGLLAWLHAVAAQSSVRSSVPASTTSSPSSPSSARVSSGGASVGSAASITPTAKCTACLLEAFNPITLKYPSSVEGNTTVTTASVNAYPTVYPDGRILTVRYETTILTIVVPNGTETIFATASWSTYGTWLTWPTSYILYNSFGLQPGCESKATALPLPASTDAAKLIFPLEGDMTGAAKQVESYLNTLDIPDNGTDFTTCQFAVLAAAVARRSGRMPIPFGPRAVPWENAKPDPVKRAPIGTNPPASEKQTAFVLTATTSTQSAQVVPFPETDKGQTPIVPDPNENQRNGGNTEQTNNNNNGGAEQQTNNNNNNNNNNNGGTEQSNNNNNNNNGNGNGNGNGNSLAENIVGAAIGAGTGNSNTGTNNNGGSQESGSGTGTNSGNNNGGGNNQGSGNGNGNNQNTGNGNGNNQNTGNGNGNNQNTGNGNGNNQNTGNGNGQSQNQGGSGTGTNNASPQVVNIGSSEVTVAPAPNGGAVIGTQTFGVGEVGTVNGQQVSVFLGGNVAIGTGSDSHTVNVGTGGSNQPPSITVADGSVVTANAAGAFVLAPGVTLQPGGSAVTVAGTTYSLANGGGIAVVNGATQTLAGTGNNNAAHPTGAAPVLTIGAQTITGTVSGGQTAFVVAPGTTLTPGGSVVVSGTTFALPASGSGSPGAIVINGVPSTLGSSPARITPAPVLTINGFTFTPTILDGSKTLYSIGPGTTLTPGGVISISGTRISLAADGRSVIFGSLTSTVVMASANATTTKGSTTTSSKSEGGVGGAIASGISATKKAGAMGLAPGGMTLEGLAIGLMGMVVYWL